ncbi:MAG: hydroxyacid dehydrogenase [Bryobacteraceae bacterium]|nr:hydroxyacid dehydrogenase [Bryobacteraceae bacterium]MDW8378978.1 hydroxyacid dehydrogenase [Bryobacterales bacterium]
MPTIVIPDDAPAVLGPSAAYKKLIARTPVLYYDTLPGSEQALIERIQDAEVVINIRSSTKFSRHVFESCPQLKLLSLWGTGTDHVDLQAAAEHGVTVTNTPGVAAVSIAEHALALLLAVARRLPLTDARVRRGEWPRGASIQLHGKTLGVIGLGAIGRQFARLGQGIGMRVLAWTFHPDPSLGFPLAQDLDELFRQSDVVSLHLRLSEQTRHLLGRAQFAAMKPGVIFINTARGPIVDEQALVEALQSGQVGGAGLDVFETEPLPPGHILTKLDNVVLTPHSAGITPEVLEAGLELAIENVWSYYAGSPQNVVKTG